MIRTVVNVILSAILVTLVSTEAVAGKRLALVIGNGNYGTLQTSNTAVRDSLDVAKSLEHLGFRVFLESNAGLRDMVRGLADFERRLFESEIALVYYSGHGVQLDGRIYLIPSDVRIGSVDELPFAAIDSTVFLNAMVRGGAAAQILILDVDLDKSLSRARSATDSLLPVLGTDEEAKGVAALLVPRTVRGTAVLFSAKPNEESEESSSGGNGVFAGALVSALEKRELTLETLFKDTARSVLEVTSARQMPWGYTSLTGTLNLRISSQPQGKFFSGNEEEVWKDIVESRNPLLFNLFLTEFPDGEYADSARLKLAFLTGTPLPAPVSDQGQAYGVAETSTANNLILQAQRLMTGLGYDPGISDGMLGPRTEKAAKAFQSSRGLTADGKINQEFVELLLATWMDTRLLRPLPVMAHAVHEERPIPDSAEETAPLPSRSLVPGMVFRDCEGGKIALRGAYPPNLFCGPEMVVIPSGAFDMGAPSRNFGLNVLEGPVHRVTFARPFAISIFEITQEEYEAVTGTNPSAFEGPRNPVEQVNWNDAKNFARILSGLTGSSYRLPSEAEWEYVARAGTRTEYAWGDGDGCSYVNCDGGCGDPFPKTAPVGQFRANAFGVFDMLGNVQEWVEDCIANYSDAPVDGAALTSGPCYGRVFRGGTWADDLKVLRPSERDGTDAWEQNYFFGFRVARSL